MKRLLRAAALTMALSLVATSGHAEEKKSFKLGYSIYVGFMPFAWLKQSGVMKKWADKYGIDVDIVLINDYVAGMNQFIAGDLDGYGAASMDALVMPAAGGVDTSIFLLGDYSNGNDAIVSKSVKSVADLKGQDVHLLQFSVSHFLLNRALALAGMSLGDVKTVNISDTEVAAAYLTQPEVVTAATWKPMVPDMVASVPGSEIIFDSSKIPGEIMDVFIGKTDVLKDNPAFAKAVTGAWYEALATMEGPDAATTINETMATGLGTDAAGLATQVATTHFFKTPAEAATFMTDAKTTEIWDYVRKFCFDQGLFGQGADSVDAIGIEMPDATVLGSKDNVKLRFDASFTQMAADGKL